MRRGKDSSSHEPVGVHTFSNEGIVQTELVGGKCTRLVRAEDINTSQGLDSREFLDDSLATSKVGGANGERGCGDDRQTNRHTNDEEDEGVDEQVVLLRGGNLDMSEEGADPRCKDEEDDENKEGFANVTEDDLEMTTLVGCGHEGGGAADEGLTGGDGDYGIDLAAFETAGVVGDIAEELVDSEGFTGDGRLVDRAEGWAFVGTIIVVVVRVLMGSLGAGIAVFLVSATAVFAAVDLVLDLFGLGAILVGIVAEDLS